MDIQVATCDGGKFDPTLGYQSEGPDCGATPLPLPDGASHINIASARDNGWIRRLFRGPKYEDDARWWSFCPEHVKIAVEQYYLGRFSDDSE